MVKVKYLGKQPILVGHKFVYQNEVHSVTAAQLAALQARHDAALFQVLPPAIMITIPVDTIVRKAAELSADSSPAWIAFDLSEIEIADTESNPEQGPATLYAAELRVHELLAPDETAVSAPANLNNQTEKPRRRRAKAG